MASSPSHDPFPYLDTSCILWCTTAGTTTVNAFLATQFSDLLPSFLNECVKVIDLVHDHWRRKQDGDLNDTQADVWECLKTWPIDADELVRVIRTYVEGKFRRGATMKGVVNLGKGLMDDKAYAAAQETLYNKVFPIGQREVHRMTREREAGLEPIQRPHPGLQKMRDKRHRNTETRKKRKFGDVEEEQVDGMNKMRKMKKSLPSFNFGVDEETKPVLAKKHDDLVVTDKGKEKETVVRSEEKEDES
ncbi:hypothetical protein KCU99_g3680, partial [Aureobasidium melanogenum]